MQYALEYSYPAGGEERHGDNVTFSEDDIRPPLPADGPGGDAAAEPEQAPPLPHRSPEELAADFRDLLSEKVSGAALPDQARRDSR